MKWHHSGSVIKWADCRHRVLLAVYKTEKLQSVNAAQPYEQTYRGSEVNMCELVFIVRINDYFVTSLCLDMDILTKQRAQKKTDATTP